MRINTNVASLVAQENAANTQFKLSSSLEKLSSGLKINKAADDASGLAIADKLRTQGTSIDQGIANGNSAVTLLQIADKSMSEQSNILDTIKAKLIQANTDTTSNDGRESIRKDISKLLEQLDNIAEQTNYNGNVLLQSASGDSATDKAASDDLNFQIGESKNDIISNTSVQSNTDGLGSKVTIANNTAITISGTKEVGSQGTITIKGADAGLNASTEQVTLSGDVDSIALTVGMTLSNVDAATQAILNTTSGVSESGGTYTVNTASTLDLSSVDNVNVDVTTVNEEQSYTATSGTVISGATVLANSALATALASTAFTAAGTGSSTTYTANGSQTLAIESGESITAKPAGTAGTTHNVTTGQIITASGGAATGALMTALEDASKFAKHGVSGSEYYVAIAAETLELGAGELISVSEMKYVGTGTGALQFNAGDEITVTDGEVISGSLLDNDLRNTGQFDAVVGTGAASGTTTYTVRDSFTTFSLSVGPNEKISIQQSEPVTLGTVGAGLVTSGITLDGTTAYEVSGSQDVSLVSGATGSVQANAASQVTLQFTIATSGTAASGAGTTYTIQAGDVFSFTDTANDALSTQIITSGSGSGAGNFESAGTSGAVQLYRALGDQVVNLDYTDSLNIQRTVGSSAAANVVSGNSAVSGGVVSGSAAPTSVTTSGKAESTLNVTTTSTLNITNTNSTTGSTLSISGDGTNDLNNGKLQLSALAALGEGELTKELADSFQAVVDDAITVLNGYRGDVGSTQNQVESAVRNLMTQSTNVKAAESIIRDVDYAQESANFNKQNIISQAGTYAMSQANSAAQNVLRLLQ